ncbi:MAG: hypothetical protein AAFY41_16765 [Bacteroidota bacterium]
MAQTDIAQTILSGVHPIFLEGLQMTFTNHVLKRYEELNEKDENTASLPKLLQSDFETVITEALQFSNSRYTEPIISLVRSLPKEELAEMAETLVSITSFIRRVSHGVETVGGPTDVAVISKKDGFVWIKRKYYFDREYNYDFYNRKSKQSR